MLNHRDPRHPRAGGSEVVLWEVCRRLSRLGVRVTWMVERFPNSQKDDVLDSVVIRRRGDPLSLHFFSLLEARRHEFVLDSVAHAVLSSFKIDRFIWISGFEHLCAWAVG